MKLRYLLALFFIVEPSVSYSADLSDPQQRMAAVGKLWIAASNIPLSRPELLTLCEGLDGARWCEGYISAVLTVYQIPQNCLPRTDMAPFMNGQVWELATEWLFTQPEASRFTFFDAITSALAEQDRCPMGAMLTFDGPELIPLTQEELDQIRNLREFLPLEEVLPDYPPLAAREGIEGWSQVGFTVTETGSVKDVVIMDADPENIFDQVSLEAAQKLQYTPRRINGEPVETPNVQHVFRFNLGSDR